MTAPVPMRPEVFAEVFESSIAESAEGKVAAGRWPRAGALESSRGDFRCPLHQGLAAPDNQWFETTSLSMKKTLPTAGAAA